MTNQPPQYPGPQPGQPYYPPQEPPKKETSRNVIIGIAIAIVALCGIGIVAAAIGGDTKDTAATTTTTAQQTTTQQTTESRTTTESAPTTTTKTTTSAAPKLLAIPDGLIGMNAQLAMEKLTDLGFTSVMPASADPDASVPVLLSNWKVTEVEPGAGTKVKPDSTIILTMVKK